MKKIYILISFLTISQFIFGQEFSFPIYFEDAIGNKDTLTMGYDINGTDGLDTVLGEINIIGVPLDTSFDVRISDAFWNNGNGTFQKKYRL